MGDFKREERYIVVKVSDLQYETAVRAVHKFLEDHNVPTRECVVVESDWSIYEEIWENVQRLAEGRPSIRDERDALAAFANEAFDAAFDGCGLDGAWIQERGAELGLIEAVEYDPEKHQIDCEIMEPGETIYVRKAWLGTKIKEPAE